MSNDTLDQNPTQVAARFEQAKEREDFQRRLHEQKVIEKTFFDFPSKFKLAPGEVLRALGTVRFDADMNPLVNGVRLTDALTNYATVNAHAIAETVAESHDRGASTVIAKSDLKTAKDKSDFIAANPGVWERLPLNREEPIDPDNLTWDQYRSLQTWQKVRIVNEKGEGFSATLFKREQDRIRAERLAGIPLKKKA